SSLLVSRMLHLLKWNEWSRKENQKKSFYLLSFRSLASEYKFHRWFHSQKRSPYHHLYVRSFPIGHHFSLLLQLFPDFSIIPLSAILRLCAKSPICLSGQGWCRHSQALFWLEIRIVNRWLW